MTHGGVDGYSLAVVYLHCGTNNRASTVSHLFREAVAKWGLPSRVCADHGGENTEVGTSFAETR